MGFTHSLILLFSFLFSLCIIKYSEKLHVIKLTYPAPFFCSAFNSTAEAVMAFVMAISDVVYDHNATIWFLDASAAICIATVLFVYGAR